jgi:acyl-CoA-binding protein
MTDLSLFNESVAKSKTIGERPSNDVLLKLYALYKQVTEGDVQGSRPGGFDFKGAAKYEAWAKLKGISQDVAAKDYVVLVNSLV